MGWLSGWSKRQAITLTGGADGSQVDFQLKLSIAYDSDMQSDFDDLRFTKEDGTTLIDAWLEDKTDGVSADVWVKFPGTPADGVEETKGYVYYGKADAVNYWDIGATFVFGDDFVRVDSNTVGGGWTEYESAAENIQINSNQLLFQDTGDSLNILKDCGLTDYRIISKTKIVSDVSTCYAFALPSTGSVSGKDGYQIELNTSDSIKLYNTNGWSLLDSATKTINTDTWYRLDIAFSDTDNTIKAYVDGEGTPSIDYTSATFSGGYVGCRAYSASDRFDFFALAKHTTNPPTYEFGSEETGGLSMAVVMHHLMQMRRS